MLTEVVSIQESGAISHAVDVLMNGGIIAFPTDTVYGLGARISNLDGLQRLYTIKGRVHTKAIAVLLSSPDELSQIADDPPPGAEILGGKFWPGPLTLILNRNPKVPNALSKGPTIGVRVPDHPSALELLALSGPLGVTSANLTGMENTATAEEVLDQLSGRIHLVLDGGATPGGVPSTVVDLTEEEPRILREGPISLEEIKKALQA